jgi:hypothetical protein
VKVARSQEKKEKPRDINTTLNWLLGNELENVEGSFSAVSTPLFVSILVSTKWNLELSKRSTLFRTAPNSRQLKVELHMLQKADDVKGFFAK